jgi:hypothetical protein
MLIDSSENRNGPYVESGRSSVSFQWTLAVDTNYPDGVSRRESELGHWRAGDAAYSFALVALLFSSVSASDGEN